MSHGVRGSVELLVQSVAASAAMASDVLCITPIARSRRGRRQGACASPSATASTASPAMSDAAINATAAGVGVLRVVLAKMIAAAAKLPCPR